MANRTIKIYGYNNASDTAITATWGGAQVFSSTLSESVVTRADIESDAGGAPVKLFEFTYNNADDTIETSHALEITVTAGSCSIGQAYSIANNDNAAWDSYPAQTDSGGMNKPPCTEIDGKYYWTPCVSDGTFGTFGDSVNSFPERINITINGAGPTGDGRSPNGTYTYNGWAFAVGNGDVFRCDVRVPKILATNPHPGKAYAWAG